MCGIAGVWALPNTRASNVGRLLANALSHRGPDGEGVEQIPAARGSVITLAHRRLSILDLTENGRQPMQDPETGNWVVFNGEIYNHKELRAELEAAGETFRSQSDTEVLLRIYARRGRGALDVLQGMFAFALWDAARSELLLAVDPLGIKPLYWTTLPGGGFAFASEVRALLDAGLAPRRADPEALASYLAYGAVQGPITAIAGVHALQAGHLLTVSSVGRVEGPKRYWRPAFRAVGSPPPSRSEAVARLKDLLDGVVAQHLTADVPVSVFLSGGVDSTVLAHFAARHARSLKSFSVSFEEAAWSEAPYFRETAASFGLDHQELVLGADELQSLLPRALDALDQPTLDGVNVFVLSKAVRGAGLKVALSGQGGDEVFGGYSTFRLVPRALSWSRPMAFAPAFSRRAVAAAWEAARGRVLPGKAEQFLRDGGDALDVYLLMRQVFDPGTRARLLPAAPASRRGLPADLLNEMRELSDGLDPVNAVSSFELRSYLGQMLLRDGDVMSMAHGLEVRVPFLDRRVVDFMASLPGSMKMETGRPKPLLLDAAGGAVPEKVWRRPKQGFTFPWELWLRGRLRPMGDEALNDAETWRALGFSPEAVVALWRAFQDGRAGLTWSRVWALIALREWAVRTKVSL